MSTKTLITVALLIVVPLAGCTGPGDDAGSPAEATTDRDPRIPPADDPGWAPISEEGIPRAMMEQPFSRVVFLQEPEAAEEEGNEGTPGFNMTEADEQVGPFEEGATFTPDRTFPPAWEIEFTDVNWDNRSLTYEQHVENGTYHDVDALPGGATILIDEETSMLSFRLDLEEDAWFYIESGSEMAAAGFPPGAFHVVSVESDLLFIDHHPAEEGGPAGPPGGPPPQG